MLPEPPFSHLQNDHSKSTYNSGEMRWAPGTEGSKSAMINAGYWYLCGARAERVTEVSAQHWPPRQLCPVLPHPTAVPTATWNL